MKKSIFALGALSLLLAACNISGSDPHQSLSNSGSSNDASSQPTSSGSPSIPTPTPSSSSAIDDDHASFEWVLNMLSKNFAGREGGASSETKIETQGRDAYISTTTENAILYKDGSSSVSGTIESGEKTIAFKKRAIEKKERYSVDNAIADYTFFTRVTDYEGTEKKDEVSKEYVFNTDSEAKSAGLTSGYVLKSQEQFLSSLQLTETLYSYVGVLATSPYVSQLNSRGFYFHSVEEGVKYETEVEYSYTEEGIIQSVNYTGSFLLDKDELKLLSIDLTITQTETRVGDESDTSTYRDHIVGTITYGAKSAPGEGLLDVDDYFLTSLEEADILNDQRILVPNGSISYGTSHYVFASPKTYSPAKAANISEWTLTPISSSNEEAISLVEDNSGSYFEIEGVGTATLTWAYFGKNDSNVWELKEYSQEVSIVEAQIEEIAFTDLFTPTVASKTLTAGTIYSQRIEIRPSYGKGIIVASSNDPETLSVSVDQSGSYCAIKLMPLKAGTATVTVMVEGNESTAISETFTIVAIPEADIPDILTASPWTMNDLYMGEFTLTFNDDKTGAWTWNYTDNGKNPVSETGDFFWKIQNGRVKITGFLSNDAEDS
ncbi:MAG: hypothetical protein J6328_00480, partial [Bacilli bacterium]|nr:hypothetical protein [Bacilli bacterium]